jgi:DNA polymerase III alpha subunit
VKTDRYGQVTLSEQEILDGIYSGKITNLENIYVDSTELISQYNQARQLNADRISELKILPELDISIEEFDKINQNSWFMPKDYCPNLIEYLYGLCSTDEQKDRVSLELELFIKNNIMDVLFYCKYLVDTMREHNILWGVGRGSSVASYVLYLIGVHKIDSLKYNLDIQEFLK